MTDQSFGFAAAITTLIRTWLGPGRGTGESTILTFGPAETIASFILKGESVIEVNRTRVAKIDQHCEKVLQLVRAQVVPLSLHILP